MIVNYQELEAPHEGSETYAIDTPSAALGGLRMSAATVEILDQAQRYPEGLQLGCGESDLDLHWAADVN